MIFAHTPGRSIMRGRQLYATNWADAGWNRWLMRAIFVQIKCEMGQAYKVAREAADTIEQMSELYSTIGPVQEPVGQVLPGAGAGHRPVRHREDPDAARRQGYLHHDHFQCVRRRPDVGGRRAITRNGSRAPAARRPNRRPHAIGRRRHVEVADAERRQRIVHRVHRRRHAPTVPASPTPLAPSGFTLVGTSRVAMRISGRSAARGIW